MEDEGRYLADATAAFGTDLKQFRVTRRFSEDELGTMLGISGNYVYMMERGKLAPAQAIRDRLYELIQSANIFAVGACNGPRERDIPVISWAQAGRATSYEEMTSDWHDLVRSACPDQQAFGIRLVGDSMEPDYRAGQVVIVMPNCVPKSGCLVVARLTVDDGVIFKKYSTTRARPNRFKLSSINRIYSPLDLSWDEVQWVYPVFSAKQTTTSFNGRRAA